MIGSGLTITSLKLMGKNALRYDAYVDVSVTIGLPILFGGGYHAMSIGVLSGIVVSIQLFTLKRLFL